MLPQGLRGLRNRAFIAYSLLRRPMTLGVRALVTDGTRVLLVRHSYVPGWHLPGGGVERGETFGVALAKELSEETHVWATEPPALFGLYRNTRHSRFDHVALYVVRRFEEGAPFTPTMEIAECRFFPLDTLPEGTVTPVRARIAEVLDGAPPSPDW